MHLSDLHNSWFLAQEDSRVFYQWVRLEQMDQWVHWFALGCVLLLLGSYVVFWYRRDWKELPRGIGWSLLLLRLMALLGILFFFFDLQKRTETEVTRTSRVAVLVDTSLSMTMPQSDSDPSDVTSAPESRIEAVQAGFRDGQVLQELRQEHDVSVYRFDQSARPALVASFLKPEKSVASAGQNYESVWRLASRSAWTGTFLVLGAVLCFGFCLFRRIRGDQTAIVPYILMGSIVVLLAGFVLIATSILRTDFVPWTSLWAREFPADQLFVPEASRIGDVGDEELVSNQSDSPLAEGEPVANRVTNTADPKEIAWESALSATGVESRIGDAVHSILSQERGSPLAGIVLLTDGRSNAGMDPLATVADAALQGIPIHTIGMGTDRNPMNVRVIDVEVPKRVFPGDRFRLNALVQASGMEGKQVTVQLRRQAGGQNAASQGSGASAIEEERTLTLGLDDTISSMLFEITPKEVGVWTYEVKVVPAAEDANPADDLMAREVRVVEPKATVLVVAGGPTREYQFVRNMLYRDVTMQSHVFLQTSEPGAAQESQKQLTEFPKTRAEMSQYDCVIAFDADWMALDAEQLQLLEAWVGEQAGGLILVAGPVSTPKWAGAAGNDNRKADILRNLSPIILNTRGARLVSLGRFEGDTPWPLKLASDALQVDFMQIGATVEASKKAWDDFAGVYGYYASYDPKPGATPIASFSDPSTAVNNTLPIYMATQFYGSGRVAFSGSGEFWRLRDVGEEFFDTFYTKLVRWAGQGRLLRDSDRGLLLLDKEQAIVGEQVMVRAVLKDAQFQPLLMSEAVAKLIDTQGRSSNLRLAPIPDPSQPGVYVGQFFTKAAGTYEVQLPVGGLADQVLLTQQVTVRVPTLEVQRPQRNDLALSEIATRTGGKYWIGMGELEGEGGLKSAITSRDQTNFLPGAPDRAFQQRLMGILMAWIVGCLSLEWLIRRISKLA